MVRIGGQNFLIDLRRCDIITILPQGGGDSHLLADCRVIHVSCGVGNFNFTACRNAFSRFATCSAIFTRRESAMPFLIASTVRRWNGLSVARRCEISIYSPAV